MLRSLLAAYEVEIDEAQAEAGGKCYSRGLNKCFVVLLLAICTPDFFLEMIRCDLRICFRVEITT